MGLWKEVQNPRNYLSTAIQIGEMETLRKRDGVKDKRHLLLNFATSENRRLEPPREALGHLTKLQAFLEKHW